MLIYKYNIPFEDFVSIQLPAGAKILSVGNQRESLCLWAAVDNSQKVEIRRIGVAGTGHYVDPDIIKNFIGTVMFRDASLVFHVFEILP